MSDEGLSLQEAIYRGRELARERGVPLAEVLDEIMPLMSREALDQAALDGLVTEAEKRLDSASDPDLNVIDGGSDGE